MSKYLVVILVTIGSCSANANMNRCIEQGVGYLRSLYLACSSYTCRTGGPTCGYFVGGVSSSDPQWLDVFGPSSPCPEPHHTELIGWFGNVPNCAYLYKGEKISEDESASIGSSVGGKTPRVNVCGSIINLNTQTVGESISLDGFPFNLNYTTLHDSKRIASRRIKAVFDYSQYNLAFSVHIFRNKIYWKSISYPAIGPVIYDEVWSGIDETGVVNPFIDSSVFNVHLSMGSVPDFDAYIDTREFKIGSYKPEVWGLGGWTLSNHHYYDPLSKVIFLGDGNQVSRELKSVVLPHFGHVFVGPSVNGEEVYIFDLQGRHLETRTAILSSTKFKFNYDDQNRLMNIVDLNGLQTDFVRNAAGRLTSIRGPFGAIVSINTNDEMRITSISPQGSGNYNFSYHNNNGLMSSIVYPDGHSVSFSYDEYGVLTSESRSDGFSQSFDSVFGAGERTLSHIRSDGIQKSYRFFRDDSSSLSQNVQVESIHGIGDLKEVRTLSDKSIEKNPTGTLTQDYVADSRWGASLRYPANITFSPATGGTPGYTIGQQKTAVLSESDNPLSLKSQSEYLSINGKVYSKLIDADSKTVKLKTPTGRETNIVLDEKERVINVDNSEGRNLDIMYNNLGLISKLSESPHHFYNYSYDNYGRLAAIENNKGNITLFNRDIAGRVTEKIFPNGEAVKFEYTDSGAVKKVITPNNQVHLFDVGLFDLVQAYVPPLLGLALKSESYLYDTGGRIKKITKASGKTTDFEYFPTTGYLKNITASTGAYSFNSPDAFGRYQSIGSPDGFLITYGWAGENPDSQALYTPNGELIGGFTIDRNADQKITTVRLMNANFARITFQYDDDGRIINLNNMVTYSYQYLFDGWYHYNHTNFQWSQYPSIKGRISYLHSGREEDRGTEIELIRGGKLWAYADGVSKQHNNDTGVVAEFRAIRAANGDFYQKQDRLNYDQNERLIGVSSILREVKEGVLSEDWNQYRTYTYGSNNNVVELNASGKQTQSTYDSQDRIINMRGKINRDYTYDADGSLSKVSNCLGDKTFEYDEFSNLRKVILPSGKVIEYKVDGLNRRVAKYVNGQPVQYYIWYDQTRLAAVYDGERTLEKYYLWGANPHGPAMLYDAKASKFLKIYTTNSGSIRYIIDSNGDFIQSIEYNEFGMVMNDTNPGYQPLGYNSGLWDPETALVRFGARDYDPSTGRWTTKDPIGFAGGDTNLYGYVGGDPVNYVDPMGLARCTFGGGVLSCTSNDGGRTISLNAFTGTGPESSENGKIPAGTYDIRKLPNSNYGTWYLDPGLFSRGLYRFGLVRGGFNLHTPGNSSNGCVTASRRENNAGNIYNLNQLLTDEMGSNTLTVLPYGN